MQDPEHSPSTETPPLPAELKAELKQVEEKAAAEKRFDFSKGGLTAALCFIAFFAFAAAMRAPILSILGFSCIGALAGFAVGTCRRTPLQKKP